MVGMNRRPVNPVVVAIKDVARVFISEHAPRLYYFMMVVSGTYSAVGGLIKG